MGEWRSRLPRVRLSSGPRILTLPTDLIYHPRLGRTRPYVIPQPPPRFSSLSRPTSFPPSYPRSFGRCRGILEIPDPTRCAEIRGGERRDSPARRIAGYSLCKARRKSGEQKFLAKSRESVSTGSEAWPRDCITRVEIEWRRWQTVIRSCGV